jgi:DNA topoisomerase I
LEGYTLIITEKPDAASRIAAALDEDGNPKKLVSGGVPYWKAYRNGEIVVVPALGHLYTVADPKKKSGYPVFNYQWVPRYQAERGASKIRRWLTEISALAEKAEKFVDACDFDVEGSIIGYCILKYACGGKEQEAKRMKYSTLTAADLQDSYACLLPKLDFGLIEAGLTRHEVDWIYGINLSRALSSAVKTCGRYATLSTGRVQGPTLKFLDDKEKMIQAFVSTPYWTVTAQLRFDGEVFAAEFEKALGSEVEAAKIAGDCKGKSGIVTSVSKDEFELTPPFPFDLGALQSEAYRLFGYSPMRTSSIAQHLYLAALISYPRTSSQRLPPSIGYQNILKKLGKAAAYQKAASELLAKPALKPHEGKKFDPAHPAVYPTGDLPKNNLGAAEQRVFDLIVKRFFAVFAQPALRQSMDVAVEVGGHRFGLNGVRTLGEGWLRFYEPYARLKDVHLPPMHEGQTVDVKKVASKCEFTQPPSRYNPRSLLLKMEKEEIGTKATRAAVMQTLQDRKYVEGTSSLKVTDIGTNVTETLSKYCPEVTSPQMTRNLEEKMDQIQEGKITKQAVLQQAISVLEPALKQLKINESAVGERLSQALDKARLEEKKIGTCPKCGSGELVILHSKKTGKRFVGCTNYFKGTCNAAFPLPQTGTVKPLGTACKVCGSPVIAVYTRGRNRWKLCINPSCTSKAAKKPKKS